MNAAEMRRGRLLAFKGWVLWPHRWVALRSSLSSWACRHGNGRATWARHRQRGICIGSRWARGNTWGRGKLFEAISARLQRRRPCDLYHSALIVTIPEGRFVIEQTPILDDRGD